MILYWCIFKFYLLINCTFRKVQTSGSETWPQLHSQANNVLFVSSHTQECVAHFSIFDDSSALLFLIKTFRKVGCYELLISAQPAKLPVRHYTVITTVLRSPYINKHGNFCAEEPEQCSVAAAAASIHHSKQNRSHISDAASRLHPRNLWVIIHGKPRKSQRPESHSHLCVLGDALCCNHGNRGQQRKALTQRWIPGERREGWSGWVSFHPP